MDRTWWDSSSRTYGRSARARWRGRQHEHGTSDLPAAARNLDLPLSRFPLRGQAGGTAASASLRLGHCTGPKQNAQPRSGPVRKKYSFLGATPPPNPGFPAAPDGTRALCCKPDRSSVNKTGQIDKLTTEVGRSPSARYCCSPKYFSIAAATSRCPFPFG